MPWSSFTTDPNGGSVLALALKRPETCKEDPARSDSNCLTSEAHNKEDPPDAKQEALVCGPWGFCVKMIPFSHWQLVSGDDSITVRCGCERCNRRDWPFFFFWRTTTTKGPFLRQSYSWESRLCGLCIFLQLENMAKADTGCKRSLGIFKTRHGK